MQVMTSIRLKPSWTTKVFDEEIVKKWKLEGCEQLEALTEEMFDRLVVTLRYEASEECQGGIRPAPVEGVFEADGAVDAALATAMDELAADLRSVQGSKIDFHPGSNEQVVDLLHPSLFCYAEGQTLVRDGCVNGSDAKDAAQLAADAAAGVCRTGRRVDFSPPEKPAQAPAPAPVSFGGSGRSAAPTSVTVLTGADLKEWAHLELPPLSPNPAAAAAQPDTAPIGIVATVACTSSLDEIYEQLHALLPHEEGDTVQNLMLFPVVARANGTMRPGNPLPEYGYYTDEVAAARYESAIAAVTKEQARYIPKPSPKDGTVEGGVLTKPKGLNRHYYHSSSSQGVAVVAIYTSTSTSTAGVAVGDGDAPAPAPAPPAGPEPAPASAPGRVLVTNKFVDDDGVLHFAEHLQLLDPAVATIQELHDQVAASFRVPATVALSCCIEVMPGATLPVPDLSQTLDAFNVENGEIFVWSAPGATPESALANIHLKSAGKFRVAQGGECQWLPSMFRVGGDGAVQIKSYINGMEPGSDKDQFGRHYPTISRLFEKFVPMFERVLHGTSEPYKTAKSMLFIPTEIFEDFWNDHGPLPPNVRMCQVANDESIEKAISRLEPGADDGQSTALDARKAAARKWIAFGKVEMAWEREHITYIKYANKIGNVPAVEDPLRKETRMLFEEHDDDDSATLTVGMLRQVLTENGSATVESTWAFSQQVRANAVLTKLEQEAEAKQQAELESQNEAGRVQAQAAGSWFAKQVRQLEFNDSTAVKYDPFVQELVDIKRKQLIISRIENGIVEHRAELPLEMVANFASCDVQQEGNERGLYDGYGEYDEYRPDTIQVPESTQLQKDLLQIDKMLAPQSWWDKTPTYHLQHDEICKLHKSDNMKFYAGTEKPFKAPDSPDCAIAAATASLRGRDIRVITKVASIELKPGEEYAGGSWHVEGEPQECIVATGLYYFSNENIADSTLHFRVAHGGQEDIESNDHEAVMARYGLDSDCDIEQPIGNISCEQGRLVAFPNSMQHMVAPFKADDPSKPAHRKILAFFLVDPAVPVLSTNEVPYQNIAWLERLLFRIICKSPGLPDLPVELVRVIVLLVPGVFNFEQAVDNRAKLMELRKSGDRLGDTFVQHCSLCEH